MSARLEFGAHSIYDKISTADGVEYCERRLGNGIPVNLPVIIELTSLFTGVAQTGIDYCLLLDRSTSMAERESIDKTQWSADTAWEAVRNAIQSLDGLLRANDDRIAIVPFSTMPAPVRPGLVPADQLMNLVRELPEPEGWTDIPEALRYAGRLFREHGSQRPRVTVLLTDGFPKRGHSPREELRDETIEAMSEVMDAGSDFVSMGIGTKWDMELLNAMSQRVGHHHTLYLDSESKCRQSFLNAIAAQQAAVLHDVKVEGVFNTDCFSFPDLRCFSPNPLGLVRLSPESGDAGTLGTHKATRCLVDLASVQSYDSTTNSEYKLLFQARPDLDKLSAGNYPVAKFRLIIKGQPMDDDMWETIHLDVVDGPITNPMQSRPQNPVHDILHHWYLARIPDIGREKRRTLERAQNLPKEHEEVQRLWTQIITILREFGDPERYEEELARFNAYRVSRNMDPHEARTEHTDHTRYVPSHATQQTEQQRANGELRRYIIRQSKSGEITFQRDDAGHN